MIVNMSVPFGSTKDGDKIINFTGEQKTNGFPALFIGKDSYIVSLQNENGLNLSDGYVYNVHVGRYCALAHEIKFVIDINHDYKRIFTGNVTLPHNDYNYRSKLKRKGQILIQNDVWIGRGAVIMGGVTIHNGAVVAANSVVTKDVGAYSIVGGNPAKHIKYRFDDNTINKLMDIQWWGWSDKMIKRNVEWFYKDARDFADHFYNLTDEQAVRNIKIDKLPVQFLYFPDFEMDKFGTWKRVITEFCNTFYNREEYGLIVFINNDKKTEEHYNKIITEIEDIESECSIYIFAGDDEEEREIFSYVDFYITNRSAKTVYHSCLADKSKVNIISGVDIPIFV